VIKGTSLINEINIPGIPSSMTVLYIDENELPGKHYFICSLYIILTDFQYHFSDCNSSGSIHIILQKYETL